MQTTAKSLQLIDASGINISPVTDLTSLYYEIERKYENTSIIARKYIYSGFPVGVNIDQNIDTNIGALSSNVQNLSSNPFYKIVDDDTNEDIIVSNISTSIISGTTYRQLNIKNYNLSEILTHYTTRELFDSSINSINSSINILNSSISILYGALDASVGTLEQILNKPFIPNKFYLINNYYYGNNGCMDIPNSSFSGNSLEYVKSLLVKANTSTALDGKLYNMYNGSTNISDSLNVYGTYEIVDSSIRITYLKDSYGNEAPYDFYNLKYKINNKFYRTFTIGIINELPINGNIIYNNIIKTNPFETLNMPVFISPTNNINNVKISNNYIGYNNKFKLFSGSSVSSICLYENNIILNNNNILINVNESQQATSGSANIKNMYIKNNNTINLSGRYISYENILLNFNNIFSISTNYKSNKLTNLIINSSNNIMFTNTNNIDVIAKNITILNNCSTYINLSDNIVVDNYINYTNNALSTSTNSVYLFGQNVFAKSFNTLRE